ncbi:kinesin-4-like [Dorcoceras hygrometricum]|uniref:Kinesin-4-like n=1 Tax=Dorcoceras hygrometricum TaxID=472368 RepID=A0A2Z7DE82_9LAMI|nr:kinesin-4-like [Dorcoceras hygrometricum]
MSCDDISLDVITISRWISADEAKRKKLKRRRCYLELAMAKRCRLHKLVRQRFDFAHIIQQDGSYNDEFSRMIFAKRFSRHEDSAGSNSTSSRCEIQSLEEKKQAK